MELDGMTDVATDRVFVIGDTPRDITCGDAIGVKTMAVATGDYSLDQLRSHSPWLALERLPDPERFCGLIEPG